MSINLPTFYVQQFAQSVELLLQTRGSKLRDKVMTGSHFGKQASPVEQIGQIAPRQVTSKFGPKVRVDAPMDRRWVFPTSFDISQFVDTIDQLKIIVDPRGSYVTNAVYAMGRAMDDQIISAFFGAAMTGETAGTSTAFPAGQTVAVDFGAAGNVGLTIAKLREAKRLLMAAEVDLDNDPLVIPMTAQQNDDLLGEQQAISLDYNTMPPLVNGKITSFMGFNFVHVERLVTDGSGFRRVPAYAKSGMHLGTWQDIKNTVNQRVDIENEPWELYTIGTFGSTRLEEKKVVEILCAE